jgi:transcriptional regulator with XRE-family HTH domain
MQRPVAGTPTLAGRLRELRLSNWPGRVVTQQELADALGNASGPLISSWESDRKPVLPPEPRLEALATFYATPRSIDGDRPHLLAPDELTPDELDVRQRLLDEFHAAAVRPIRTVSPRVKRSLLDTSPRLPLVFPGDAIGGGQWWFEDGLPITIVCARLPEDKLAAMPYSKPEDPDYVKFYTFADLDALIELHGHIRAVNPASQVHIRAADELVADDLSDHLVLLGGVDWNPITRDVIRRLDLPVEQQARSDGEAYDACFKVVDDGKARQFGPVVEKRKDRVTLREDVGCFYRGINPHNAQRTVTICNGMFGRGTLGVVRTLTDARFRDRNEDYINKRFLRAGSTYGISYGILSRVVIVKGETVTPDWTNPATRLFEWPGVSE